MSTHWNAIDPRELEAHLQRFDARRVPWEEVAAALALHLPVAYLTDSDHIGQAARRQRIAFDFRRLPRGEEWTELAPEALFDALHEGLALRGEALACTDASPGRAFALPAASLRGFVRDFPGWFYEAADVTFVYPELRLLVLLQHHGWFAHVWYDGLHQEPGHPVDLEGALYLRCLDLERLLGGEPLEDPDRPLGVAWRAALWDALDRPERRAALATLAGAGEPDAQLLLAWLHAHRQGGGLPGDALSWYRRAAASGSLAARVALAALLPGERDPDHRWFLELAPPRRPLLTHRHCEPPLLEHSLSLFGPDPADRFEHWLWTLGLRHVGLRDPGLRWWLSVSDAPGRGGAAGEGEADHTPEFRYQLARLLADPQLSRALLYSLGDRLPAAGLSLECRVDELAEQAAAAGHAGATALLAERDRTLGPRDRQLTLAPGWNEPIDEAFEEDFVAALATLPGSGVEDPRAFYREGHTALPRRFRRGQLTGLRKALLRLGLPSRVTNEA
jgi:hypothetical protein